MNNLKDYKITILGDSIAKGIVIENNKILKIKENAVHIIEEKFNLNIDNQSYFGQTLKKITEKGFIDRYLASINKANKNCLVLSIGGNDSDFDWKKVGLTPTCTDAQHTTFNEFSTLLQNAITKLQASNVEVVLTTLTPLDAQKFFKHTICEQAPMQNALVFLNMDISNIYRMQERFSNEIVRLAIKNDCTLFDIRSMFLMQKNMSAYLCEDGIHPNILGQELIANTVIQKIESGEILIL